MELTQALQELQDAINNVITTLEDTPTTTPSNTFKEIIIDGDYTDFKISSFATALKLQGNDEKSGGVIISTQNGRMIARFGMNKNEFRLYPGQNIRRVSKEEAAGMGARTLARVKNTGEIIEVV